MQPCMFYACNSDIRVSRYRRQTRGHPDPYKKLPGVSCRTGPTCLYLVAQNVGHGG